MEADIHELYVSDFYRVLDFKCRCKDCQTSKPEYSDSFCISFVRKGNFLFNVFRNSFDSYTGCVLIIKPGYERTVTHVHTVPDECTIIEFKKPFFDGLLEQYGRIKFFTDPDLHSTLVRINPETEFHHYELTRLISSRGSKLEIDNLVIELIETVVGKITDYKPDIGVYSKLKKNHLVTIERAKEYITQNFKEDLSLSEVARHCCLSPFHFSRIFRSLTQYTPHKFLSLVRLTYSEIVLKNTPLPVADVAFSSGFNSIEHFTSTFKNRYALSPARFSTSAPSLKLARFLKPIEIQELTFA